jgi:hypothetical protein
MNSENLIRDLSKIYDVLTAVSVHLDAKDSMNAALHMSPSIRSTPLAAAVQGARADTANLVSQLSGNGINTGGGQ